jgi:hypothetical protein
MLVNKIEFSKTPKSGAKSISLPALGAGLATGFPKKLWRAVTWLC